MFCAIDHPIGCGATAFLALVMVLAMATGCASTGLDADSEDGLDRLHDQDVVVVVHGMGRTGLSMLPVKRSLEDQGYEVINWSYSSFCCSTDELADELGDDLHTIAAAEPSTIHFVGHSLGNIVVQAALEENPPAQHGRFVMLAPPNNGSASADRYVDWFGWLLVPMADLTTDHQSTVQQLQAPQHWEIGVIAGQYDGKVSIDESHHPAEDDHTVVPTRHTFIMMASDVRELTAAFLESGEF